MKRCTAAITAAVCLVLLPGADAAVDYLAGRDLLWVTDYPEDFPCTPRLLARIDDTFGWDKVTYDETTQTCTVACSLWIGRNDGSQTWFQVGSAQRPTETLVVRGNVRVHSTWLTGENTGTFRSAHSLVNRLTLGVRENPVVRASLLIDNRDRQGHTLTVGGSSGYGAENNGGELCVYYGLIGPHGDAKIGERARGNQPLMMGGQKRIELVAATVRDVSNTAFGRHLAAGLFKGVSFERCGTALHGTYQEAVQGCTFSDCGTALTGSSRFDLVLHDCTFIGNRRNWTLLYRPLIAVDCVVDDWDKGAYSTEHATFVVSKRHVVVRVLDGAGKPVNGAAVRATAAVPPPAATFDLNHAVTGADGCTPGQDTVGALLISQLLIRPGEQEDAPPLRTTYRYTLEARVGNRTGRVDGVTPLTSWQKITITLGERAQHEEEDR